MKLLNRDRDIKKERDLRRCRVASNLLLKYGRRSGITEQQAEEFYEDGIYDSISSLRAINLKNVRWYIHNKIEINDPIWNADFISGITQSGVVIWNKCGFPTFNWYTVPILADILESCPFYGKVQKNKSAVSGKHPYSWKSVPALCLKPSKETVSYVAGVLCAGKIMMYKGENFIKCKFSCREDLKKFGIPVEREDSYGLFISPFWPALLSIHMPECCRDYFLKIKKAYKGEEYAAILWATHASHNITKGGLPFLPSRRTVFYRYKNEDGTLKELQKRRLKYDLVSLDNRVKSCLASWISKN